MPRTDPTLSAYQHNDREAVSDVPVVIAAAGATQGNATPVGLSAFVLASATTSAQGLRLPTLSAAIGGVRRVIAAMSNRGVKVYPATGQRLTGAATNAAITVPLNRVYTFISDGASGLWRLNRGAAS